jgi:hypothetical protein
MINKPSIGDLFSVFATKMISLSKSSHFCPDFQNLKMASDQSASGSLMSLYIATITG